MSNLCNKSETQIFIHYDENGRGFRSAIAFCLINDNYYGYFLGYSGGGTWADEYFKLSKNLKKYLCINNFDDEYWYGSKILISEPEIKILYEIQGILSKFCIADDCSWTLNEEKRKLFRIGKDSCLYYETENLNMDVIKVLQEHWDLLTIYS